MPPTYHCEKASQCPILTDARRLTAESTALMAVVTGQSMTACAALLRCDCFSCRQHFCVCYNQYCQRMKPLKTPCNKSSVFF